MSLWPGLKLRDTAGRITLIWPPLITWRKWTDWLTQLMGVTMVQPGLDSMMMWTAGDGHWKTMISIRKEREISETLIMNQTMLGMNCVFTWIIMENGLIIHVAVITHLSAMMVRQSNWKCIFYIYIYAFNRRFYPKRLTLHSSYSFYILSALAFPGNRTHDLGVANAMLYQLSYRKAQLVNVHVFTYMYIYAFSRCFYPKRLTVHSGNTFIFLSVCVFPGNWTHKRLYMYWVIYMYWVSFWWNTSWICHHCSKISGTCLGLVGLK